jgi:hypothetical protein
MVDATARYTVKLGFALLWTLGPCLLFVPRGIVRAARREGSWFLLGALALSVLPALVSHLTVHFGVPGYAFHYVPALLALAVLGIERAGNPAGNAASAIADLPDITPSGAAKRLYAISALMAALFLFYPTDYSHPGWRGDFDLSFARHTRMGLRTPVPRRQPSLWRTANSRVGEGPGAEASDERTGAPRS